MGLSKKGIFNSLPSVISTRSTNYSSDWDDTGPMTPTRESEKDPLQDLVDLKREHPNQQLLLHLNINSLQNKFDELKVINAELKAGIIVLTETKIDSCHTNAQSSLPGELQDLSPG